MLKRLIGMRKLLLVVLGKEILLKLNLKVMQMWLIKLRNLFLYQLYCYVFIYFLVIQIRILKTLETINLN